jgi:ABC-2 type transport system permease protein
MKKYSTLFLISLQEFFTYRLNFVMWRVRQLFVFLIPYFIWRSVFSGGGTLYNYDFKSLMTYLFGTTILRSLVMGGRTSDLGWMINSGYLSIPLLKPLSIFRFLFIRDIADKVYNLSFIFFELPLLYFVFRPPLFLQTNFSVIIITLLSILSALTIYFFISLLFGCIAFWSRDVWAPRFLLWVVMEFTTGALFPLDMLSANLEKIILYTPFPYLLYVPLKLYLNAPPIPISFLLLIQFAWLIILYFLAQYIWQKGLRVYEAEGR